MSREWSQRKVAAGECARCGQPRGKRGTNHHCRPCANAHSRRQTARYYALKPKAEVAHP